MTSRMRTSQTERGTILEDQADYGLELDALSGDELEALLFDEEPQKESGFFNFPTVAGLAMIVVGVVYLLQEFDLWNGFDITFLASTLPWLAGILIILIGFGVMSWRPRKRKRKVKKGVDVSTGEKVRVETEPTGKRDKKRLVRSKNKQVAGVCGGVADYFNLDPTLVRIAFVVAAIATSGWPVVLTYLVLAWVMPKPEALAPEERITILRDS